MIPPLHFGNVYVKMRHTHWLQCFPDQPPQKADKDDIKKEFEETGNAISLLIETNRGLYREDAQMFWHMAQTIEERNKQHQSKKERKLHDLRRGNPFAFGAFDGLGVVLTGKDVNLIGGSSPNDLKQRLNRAFGGKNAVVSFAKPSKKEDYKRKDIKGKHPEILITSEPHKKKNGNDGEETRLKLVGADIFDKHTRASGRMPNKKTT